MISPSIRITEQLSHCQPPIHGTTNTQTAKHKVHQIWIGCNSMQGWYKNRSVEWGFKQHRTVPSQQDNTTSKKQESLRTNLSNLTVSQDAFFNQSQPSSHHHCNQDNNSTLFQEDACIYKRFNSSDFVQWYLLLAKLQ